MSNAPHYNSLSRSGTDAEGADRLRAAARLDRVHPPRRHLHQEKRIEVFSSYQPGGLMNVSMGHNMMRKDGAAHMCERAQMFPSVSPRAVGAASLTS